MSRNVYLPIEIKARGLSAKLLLATQLLEYGFNVIIGTHGKIRDLALKDKNGIYIEKDFFYLRYDSLKKMKDNGFLIYSYDEEGLIYLSDQLYIDTRTHNDTLSICDKVFTWGEAQNNVLINRYDNISNKFSIIGNPRIDLITHNYMENIYSYEISKIKQIGKYILINSNFSIGQDADSFAENIASINRAHGKEDCSSKYIPDWRRYWEKKANVYDSFISAISYIADKVDMKIVIRIHPSENIEKWNCLTKFKNVIITSKYDANPWMYCAEAVIHNNCTTGLEAFLLGKKVISFVPSNNCLSDLGIPDKVSLLAHTKEELLYLVQNYNQTNTENENFNNTICKYILLDNMKGVAIPNIISQILSDCKEMKAESLIVYTDNYILNALDPILYFGDRYISKKRRKFAYETKKQLESRIHRLINKKVSSSDYKVIHIGINTFCVSKLRI